MVDEPAPAAAAAAAGDGNVDVTTDEMTGLVLNSTADGDAGLCNAVVADEGCDGRSKHTRLGRRTVSVLSASCRNHYHDN